MPTRSITARRIERQRFRSTIIESPFHKKIAPAFAEASYQRLATFHPSPGEASRHHSHSPSPGTEARDMEAGDNTPAGAGLPAKSHTPHNSALVYSWDRSAAGMPAEPSPAAPASRSWSERKTDCCRSLIFITPFMVLKHRTSIARF